MRSKVLRRDQNCGGRNLTEGNERDREGDGRNRWRDTEMTDLADSASGFILVLGMRVRNDLNQK